MMPTTKVFPQPDQRTLTGVPIPGSAAGGISKRELFACTAMQALLSAGDGKAKDPTPGLAALAVKYADALLLELMRPSL